MSLLSKLRKIIMSNWLLLYQYIDKTNFLKIVLPSYFPELNIKFASKNNIKITNCLKL